MEHISSEEVPPIYPWDTYRKLVVRDTTLEKAIKTCLDKADARMQEAERTPKVTQCGREALKRTLQCQIAVFVELFLEDEVVWFPEPSLATVTQLRPSDSPKDIPGKKPADTPCDLMPDAV